MPAFLLSVFHQFSYLERWTQLVSPWFMITVAAYTIGGLLLLVGNYFAASSADRKRLRVAIIGSGAGFFSLLLL